MGRIVSAFEVIRFLAAMGLALACASCGSSPIRQGIMTPVTATADGTARVKMLVATTRQPSSDAGEMFGGERAGVMSFATVGISIPPDDARKIGEVQWPVSSPGDPRRDFVTVSANYLDKKDFAPAIAAMSKSTGRSKVLVFVHGFNNRFDDAVFRFAQIVHDSKAPVIPVLFTWPSRGEVRLRGYNYDKESANYSRDALEELLGMVTSNPHVSEVVVLAHSMGNWLTLEALRGRSMRAVQAGRAGPDKLKNALLVAPDVDVDVFRMQVQRMGAMRPRMSLFVSQDDGALELSETLAGGIPRLGRIDPETEPYRSELEKEGIVVFDLTTLKSDGSAHSRAFDEVSSVVGMLRQRLGEGQKMSDPGSQHAGAIELSLNPSR
jgi:esterase/lipase superfamily enzyme